MCTLVVNVFCVMICYGILVNVAAKISLCNSTQFDSTHQVFHAVEFNTSWPQQFVTYLGLQNTDNSVVGSWYTFLTGNVSVDNCSWGIFSATTVNTSLFL